MESGSSSTGKKKHDTEEDILHSKLYEPQLISHILSFLPTTDAFRTSVLSKKWINNWKFITKLDFDDGLYDGEYSCRICAHCEAASLSIFYVCDKVIFLFFLLLWLFNAKPFLILLSTSLLVFFGFQNVFFWFVKLRY